MELIIIRHGQSYVNLGKWHTLKTMDTSLTDLGHQQAQSLRDWLKRRNVRADALYASSMRRTQETADYVSEALGLDAVIDHRLREVGNSHLDGEPVDEPALPRSFATKKGLSQFAPTVTDVDNAESWMHFRIRLGQFVEEKCEQHKNKTVYVVAHGGVMSAIIDNMFGVGLQRSCDVHTDNTGWTRLKYQSSQFADWTLHEFNRVDHLIEAGLG